MSRTDQVVFKDLSIFARHSLLQEEGKLGQRFFIDVVVDADLRVAEGKDRVEGTINLAELIEVTNRPLQCSATS